MSGFLGKLKNSGNRIIDAISGRGVKRLNKTTKDAVEALVQEYDLQLSDLKLKGGVPTIGDGGIRDALETKLRDIKSEKAKLLSNKGDKDLISKLRSAETKLDNVLNSHRDRQNPLNSLTSNMRDLKKAKIDRQVIGVTVSGLGLAGGVAGAESLLHSRVGRLQKDRKNK